jgi:hypothetical protein
VTLLKHHNPTGNTAGTGVTQANSGGTSTDDYSRLLTTDIEAGATYTYASRDGKIVYLYTQSGAGRINWFDTWVGSTSDFSWTWEDVDFTNSPSATAVLLQLFSDDAYGAGAVVMAFQMAGGTPVNRLRIFDNVTATTTTSALGLGTRSAPPSGLSGRWTITGRYQATTNTLTVTAYPYGSATSYTSVSATIPTDTVINSIRGGLGTASVGLTYSAYDRKFFTNQAPTRTDVVASPPTVSKTLAAERTYQAGTNVSFGWTASITGDTIASMVVDWPTKPPGAADPTVSGSPTGLGTTSATLNATATLGSIGGYVARVTVTPTTGGAPAAVTNSYDFYMYPAAETPTTVRQTLKGAGATVIGGAANTDAGAGTSLFDSNTTTTGVESTASNPVDVLLYSSQMGPIGPTGIIYRFVPDVDAGGTGSYRIRVTRSDHTTLVYETTKTVLSTDPVDWVEVPLDSTALASIPLASPTDVQRGRGLWVDVYLTVT